MKSPDHLVYYRQQPVAVWRDNTMRQKSFFVSFLHKTVSAVWRFGASYYYYYVPRWFKMIDHDRRPHENVWGQRVMHPGYTTLTPSCTQPVQSESIQQMRWCNITTLKLLKAIRNTYHKHEHARYGRWLVTCVFRLHESVLFKIVEHLLQIFQMPSCLFILWICDEFICQDKTKKEG